MTREENLGSSRSLVEAQPLRHVHCRSRIDRHALGIAPAPEQGHHSIPHLEPRNALTHFRNGTRALKPENVGCARRWRVQALGLHQVGAIDCAADHID